MKPENAISTITKEAAIACNASKVEALTDAALRGETIKLVNLIGADISAQAKTVSEVDKLRKAQGEILFRVDKTGLYKKDGFKNLSEYAETMGLSEDVKSRISQMKTAGEVILDKDAPDNLKNLPYTVIGQMGAIIHDKDAYAALKEEAKKDGFTLTQTEAKERAKALREAKNPTVVKQYGALVNGNYIRKDKEILYLTEAEWKCDTGIMKGEVIKISNDTQGRKRYLTIVDDKILTLYTLVEKPTDNKPKKPEAPKPLSIADMAAFLGVTVEELTELKNAKKNSK